MKIRHPDIKMRTLLKESDAFTTGHSVQSPERILLLSLTSGCACDCIFCGLPQSARHTSLSPGVLSVALQGHPDGAPWEEVNLTGGDPLVVRKVRGLFNVLSLHRQHYDRISVCTAGIPARAAEEGLRALSELVGRVELYVSIDGVGVLHDRIRGRSGAFSEVERFVAIARHLTSRLVMHCVINQQNLCALDDLADYATSVGLPLAFGLVNRSDHYINNEAKYGAAGLTVADAGKVHRFFARRAGHYDKDVLAPVLGGRRQRACRLLREGILVTSDGDIAVCGTSKTLVLGSFSEPGDPKVIWREILERRQERIECSSACQNCTYTW